MNLWRQVRNDCESSHELSYMYGSFTTQFAELSHANEKRPYVAAEWYSFRTPALDVNVKKNEWYSFRTPALDVNVKKNEWYSFRTAALDVNIKKNDNLRI